MDTTKTFLESSTIHGLLHISTNKKYATKLFWIVVVILGFTAASYMIYESFQTWADSPIKTTIETLPITKITLPKVTVCPPQKTFTDLNYDLLKLENITLNNHTRRELKTFASDVLLNHLEYKVTKTMSLLKEEDRYYNWYNGYSRILIPNPTYEIEAYDVETYSLSGIISTQYFGERFQLNKIDTTMKIVIQIRQSGFHYIGCEEPTLHFDIKKVSMKGLISGVDEFFIGWDLIDSDISSFSRNFTSLDNGVSYIYYKRNVSNHAISRLNLTQMPGFELQWYYTCYSAYHNPTEDVEDNDERFLTDKSLQFVRYIFNIQFFYIKVPACQQMF